MPKDVLTKCERAVYDYIALLEERHQICNPSIKQICQAIEFSERAVQSALRRLQDSQIIGVDHKQAWRSEGEPAPQRWTRPMTLRDKQAYTVLEHCSETAPSGMISTLTQCQDLDKYGNPIDHYWKYMDYIEQNTDRIKHGPKAKPATVATQQPIDFDAWPW